MKKILIVLAIVLTGMSVFAEDFVLQGGVTFDWLTISQEQRDVAVENFQKIVFEDYEGDLTKSEFRAKYADFLKDKDYKKHYMLASEGFLETEEYNICAFQTRGGVLMVYAIQYKNDLRKTYYYDAFGNLRYVDETSENYPNFPYYTRQYRVNGALASAVYVESHDVQYIYEPDGKFKGIWYKDKMFNQKAKQIMTRTNW